ncbi:small subunit ribosomal protein S14 [Halorubrum alkaliphilum]|uniref:Small ribosomal subunit protein uS14 n=1 Tax=Halorubrum alkaliphilum TaxID=261290 RepID=A0A8T4GDL5_9EURY|nr:30S ribosomal protein S14 [Halorubrum alkaliphilum]MBP1921730.1 small subunit ribosomal protein S14 [Halorubrum alkaliphilum]
MSEANNETGEHAAKRTSTRHTCRRCDREQGLVGKYDINLCRQCFREVARDMGFEKYS